MAHWVNLSELREWGFMMCPTEVPHQSTEAKPLKQSLPSGCTSTSALDKLGRSTLVKPRNKITQWCVMTLFGRSTLRRHDLLHKERVSQVAKRGFGIQVQLLDRPPAIMMRQLRMNDRASTLDANSTKRYRVESSTCTLRGIPSTLNVA